MNQKILRPSMLAILGMTILAVAQPSGSRCVLRIRSEAALTRPVVCLGDVVMIQHEDKAFCERLSTLVLTQAGEENSAASIGVFEISRALAAAGINPISVDIFGARACQLRFDLKAAPRPEPVKVAPIPTPVGRTVADQLSDYIASATGLDRGRLLIEYDCREEGFLEQAADAKRFMIKPLGPVNLGTLRFDIIDNCPLTESGRGFERVRISSDVRLVCETIVVIRPLVPGQVITKEDVKLVAQTLDDSSRCGMSRLDEVIGKELCRPLKAHETVMPWMLKKLVVVHRNDAVDILNDYKGIRITLQGKAQSDGAQDDIISVQVKNSSNTLRCRVQAPGIVEVLSDSGETQLASAEKGRDQR